MAIGPAGSAGNSHRPPQEERELTPVAPIEREIAGGEVHLYRITLGTRQFVRISASQREIDLFMRVIAPGGQTLVETKGLENLKISFLSEPGGVYRLEVGTPKGDAVRGSYEVRIDELRAATPHDESRVAAERALAEGGRLSEGSDEKALSSAIAKYEEAFSLYQSADDRQGQANALIQISLLQRYSGELQKALDPLLAALPLAQSAKDRFLEAKSLHGLGRVHYQLGNLHQALEYFHGALNIDREIGDKINEAFALVSIGITHSSFGEYPKALDYYMQSLALIPAAQQHREGSIAARLRLQAYALENIGNTYADMGGYQEALEYLNQVLSLCREQRYPYGELHALNKITKVYVASGELLKALECLNQCLAICETIGARVEKGRTLLLMGMVYSDLGKPQKALEVLRQALDICRSQGIRTEEATSLNEIGSMYARLGEPQKALEYFTRALSLSQSIGRRSVEAAALYGQARVQSGEGNLNSARAKAEAALEIIESSRTEVTGQQLRASYLASKRSYYELYIDLLMRQHESQPSAGHNATALQVSERGRARSLLESLVEARAEIRQGVDPALLGQERMLQQQLNTKAARLTQLLSGQHSMEQVEALRKEVDSLITRLQEVQARIRSTSPRYAALTQPVPLGLNEIRQQVLDDQTLLLEYSLGEERSFLWAVTTSSISSFELPDRNQIEASARRVYELLTMSHTRQRKRESELAAADLSRLLLGPVAHLLEKRRLLIIADGTLQYIPFGALPVPQKQKSGGDSTPLIVEHEIVSLPSASVLAVMRQELTGRQPADRLVAVLADPVLSGDDSRVKQAMNRMGQSSHPQKSLSGNQSTARGDVERSAAETGVTSLERLLFTRREADSILTLAHNSKILKALDFDASRATATSPELSHYRIVHFATHGLINSRHPELSGLVLSLVDKEGRPQDGFLRAHDVYNLKLEADLVVLSACRTALGKQIKGEGLIGLVRGFMYAGAPRVVASLWDVRDEATAELMKRFYQGMINQSLRPAEALRAAQVSMWKEPRWRAPYYWASFVLQGEWR